LFFNRFTLAIFLVLSVLVGTSVAVNCDGSSRCYIRQAASGTGTGADWTNACTGFTGNCALSSRGITYFVAKGTYTGQHITVGVSGSTQITVKGATAADHGIATGWVNSFSVSSADGGSQAVFNWFNTGVGFWSIFWIDTSFVTVDGNTGTDGSPTTYGFAAAPIVSCASHDWQALFLGGSGDASNVTGRWYTADFGNCAQGDTVVREGWGEHTTGNFNNNTASHIYCNKTQDCVTYHWSNGNVAATGNIIEYLWIPIDGAWGETFDTGHHGEQINLGCQDGIQVRYNTILDGKSTGLFVANDFSASCDVTVGLSNGKIYGNVFANNTGGNGTITCTGASAIRNTVVYNNTIINNGAGAWFGCNGVFSGNTAKNNIVWTGTCAYTGTGGAPTHDFNSYLSCSDTPPTETNRQVASLNPFVASGSNNYHLTNDGVASCASSTATCNGDSTIGATYNTDPGGLTRGSDGTWERGAFEFQSGGLSRSVSASVTFAVAAARVLAAVRNPSASVGFTALSQGVRGTLCRSGSASLVIGGWS
jgi:hypothetical protein